MTFLSNILLLIDSIAADIKSITTRINRTDYLNYDKLSKTRTNVDANGLFQTIVISRPDGTLHSKSILSGGTTPYYTTRTETYYDTDGTTVLRTNVFTLGYTNGKVTSETINT